ncbi:hypothetical protein [Pseudomonas putida]|uniref:hypothetical protein n=1 Tax=Pseudomonas putida TaxID=303 RepID=UPI0039DF69C4
MDLSKITASIVSLEAGFDRGYLKKSRKSHLPLLAKIEICRAEACKGGSSANRQKIERLEENLRVLEYELAITQAQRNRILTQNLQLWERVRELELAVVQYKSLKTRLHH